MDWQKELRLPDWLLPELKEHAKQRQRIKPLPAWRGEVLSSWIATTNVLMRIEERLLTQPEMRAVWSLFEKRNKRNRAVYFVTKAVSLYLDAAGRYLPKGQKAENDSIYDLKQRVSRQIKNLSETIEDVERTRGLFEQRELMLKQLSEIQAQLNERLGFSIHQIPARVELVGKPLKAIRSTRNVGSKKYIETVLKKGISELFEEIFEKPHAGLARIVSLMMLGQEIPKERGDSDHLRTQVYDAKRIRKKRQRK